MRKRHEAALAKLEGRSHRDNIHINKLSEKVEDSNALVFGLSSSVGTKPILRLVPARQRLQ